MLWRWELGRQGSGYAKLLLAQSKRFKFDVYLLSIPVGVEVPRHRDPCTEGYEHHRVNITLRFPRLGGMTIIDCVEDVGQLEIPRARFETRRVYRFRPDLYRHMVTEVRGGKLLLLSIGWLRKKRK